MKASPRKVPALRAAWIIASASKAVSAHRLFAQHVLAGFGRLDRPFGVARVRRRDIDRIDLRVGEQRLVAVDDARAGKRLGEPGLAGIARADRHELAGARMRDAAGKGLGDAARPDNAPADLFLRKSCHYPLNAASFSACGWRSASAEPRRRRRTGSAGGRYRHRQLVAACPAAAIPALDDRAVRRSERWHRCSSYRPSARRRRR